MAAEIALFQAALEDPRNDIFVLLPHDVVPLQSPAYVLKSLLETDSSMSRVCPAGVRDIDVPHDCAHAIEPHWSRSLMLKHHQWLTLSRVHAARLVNPKALTMANEIFESEYLGEPLCSDEILPLLSLALSEKTLKSQKISLSELPLYLAAAHGTLEEGFQQLGLRSECLLYAPWPGCGAGKSFGGTKHAKSPLGDAMSSSERDALLVDLADQGILFARKLGLFKKNVTSHMEFLRRNYYRNVHDVQELSMTPSRLLPLPTEECCTKLVMARWTLASIKARLPVPILVAISGFVAYLAGKCVVAQGIWAKNYFHWVIAIYVAGHLGVFMFSVVAFSEYSLLEPLLKAGLLQRTEL